MVKISVSYTVRYGFETHPQYLFALLAKLVDALDLEFNSIWSEGSTPL